MISLMLQKDHCGSYTENRMQGVRVQAQRSVRTIPQKFNQESIAWIMVVTVKVVRNGQSLGNF